MSTDRCMAKLNRSPPHADSIIDNGHTMRTRLITFCCKRKSAAHIAEPVFPVPCSLKQNARLFMVRKEAVVF